MESRKSIVFTLLVLCSYNCFGLQWLSTLDVEHVLVGKIFNTKTQALISQKQLLIELRKTNIVLVGEKHDNPDHHQIESLLLDQLVNTSTNVVFEMLNTDQQAGVKQLDASMALNEIKQTLGWSESNWSWQNYGPLLKTVLQKNGQLVAGNINTAFMMRIYREPQLLNSFYSSSKTITPAIKIKLSDQVFEQHCGMLPRSKTDAMVRVQLARDAQMAQAIALSTPPAILIAGGFHVRKDVSVPLHLDIKNGGLTSLLISEVSATKTSLQEYPRASASQVDFIWFTPRFSDEDYCAALGKKH